MLHAYQDHAAHFLHSIQNTAMFMRECLKICVEEVLKCRAAAFYSTSRISLPK